MKSTHTLAIMEVSPRAHAEIMAKLHDAGPDYQQRILDERDPGPVLDMQGIGIVASAAEGDPADIQITFTIPAGDQPVLRGMSVEALRDEMMLTGIWNKIAAQTWTALNG